MTGKLLAIILVVSAVLAGVGMYYLQVYGFYYDVASRPGQDVFLLAEGADAPNRSPIRRFGRLTLTALRSATGRVLKPICRLRTWSNSGGLKTPNH